MRVRFCAPSPVCFFQHPFASIAHSTALHTLFRTHPPAAAIGKLCRLCVFTPDTIYIPAYSLCVLIRHFIIFTNAVLNNSLYFLIFFRQMLQLQHLFSCSSYKK
ncbi:hypothetical protein HMPREF3190_00883 [Umbribacter vaginalis]|nr:hypothetical protein HMPREF3190_00883 [Coriobacteriales bacterium DNF00809]